MRIVGVDGDDSGWLDVIFLAMVKMVRVVYLDDGDDDVVDDGFPGDGKNRANGGDCGVLDARFHGEGETGAAGGVDRRFRSDSRGHSCVVAGHYLRIIFDFGKLYFIHFVSYMFILLGLSSCGTNYIVMQVRLIFKMC